MLLTRRGFRILQTAFVGEQDRGAAEERSGDRHPLLLPA